MRIHLDGKVYDYLEVPGDSDDEMVKIKFIKHDIGTWSVYAEDITSRTIMEGYGRTAESALFKMLFKHFGIEIEKAKYSKKLQEEQNGKY